MELLYTCIAQTKTTIIDNFVIGLYNVYACNVTIKILIFGNKVAKLIKK